jgi:hypothetical protein
VKNLHCILAAALMLGMGGIARAGDDTKPKEPLTEAALIKLSKTNIEDEIVAAVVKTRGVAFKTDAATIKRLQQAGVADVVLAVLKPGGDETKPSDDANKPLGTGNFQKGLVIDVTDVKRTSDDFLKVSFRIRNPTKDRITHTISGVYFVPEMYYIEVGGDGKKYSVVRDGAGNYDASRVPGTITVEPRGSIDYWAKFGQPGKDVKKISLYFRQAEPIEDIPVPPSK